jgi:hypothetical protein
VKHRAEKPLRSARRFYNTADTQIGDWVNKLHHASEIGIFTWDASNAPDGEFYYDIPGRGMDYLDTTPNWGDKIVWQTISLQLLASTDIFIGYHDASRLQFANHA